MFRRMGPIYYWLEVRLSEFSLERLTEERRKRNTNVVGVKTFLRERGATNSEIGNGALASRAYALVVHGKMTEAEYAVISWERCYEIAKGTKRNPPIARQPRRVYATSRTKKIEPVSECPPSFSEDTLEEIPKTETHLLQSLEAAQRWLIEARNCLGADSPPAWNEYITRALTPVGKLRFEIGEAAKEAKRA